MNAQLCKLRTYDASTARTTVLCHLKNNSLLRATKSDSTTAVELRGVHRVYQVLIYQVPGMVYVLLRVCT